MVKTKKQDLKYAQTFIIEYFTFSTRPVPLFVAIALIMKMVIPAIEPESRFEEILNSSLGTLKITTWIIQQPFVQAIHELPLRNEKTMSSYVLTVLRRCLFFT